MKFHSASLLTLSILGGAVACSSNVEGVPPRTSGSTEGTTASASVSASASQGSLSAGALSYRISFTPQPIDSVDIYGRACPSASGSLINTLTGSDFYHLSGSALMGSGQILQVTASMEKTSGRVTGSISSAQAYMFGSFSGLAWGDQALRTWSSTGGCAGFWNLSEGRSALADDLPESDVFSRSRWNLRIDAEGLPGENGTLCTAEGGQIEIEAGQLTGHIAASSGETNPVRGSIDASGKLHATTASGAWRVEGVLSASHGQGNLTGEGACQASWRAERLPIQ